jgi:hypothetical protein
MERDADLPRGRIVVDREAASFMTSRAQYCRGERRRRPGDQDEARKLTSSKAAHEALSQTRRRTVKTAEFPQCALCRRAPCLARHLQLPQRSGRQFRAICEGKLRTKDRFITGFGTNPCHEGRLIVAMGDGPSVHRAR